MNTLLRAIIPIAFLSLYAEASEASLCPSRHFEPTTYYRQAFGGSEPVTEYRVANIDEDLAFQYIEYQTRERGFLPVFSVTIVRSEAGTYRVALVRATEPVAKDAKPLASATYRELPPALAERAIPSLARILRNTHYPAKPCAIGWLDGYIVQAMVASVPGYGDLVGEAFSPPSESDAGSVVTFGRRLRSYLEGKATLQDIQSAIPAKEPSDSSPKQVQD